MNNKETIEDFISQRSLAVVGISRGGKGFGNMAMRELKARGYTLYPIHPSAETLEGEACYPNLGALPEKVGGVLVVVPPAQTARRGECSRASTTTGRPACSSTSMRAP